MGHRKVCLLSDKGLLITDGVVPHDHGGETDNFEIPDATLYRHSPSLDRIAVACQERLVVLESSDLSTVSVLELSGITDIEFSPRGKYLVIQERHRLPTKNPDGTLVPYHNIKILRTATLETVTSCNMRNPSPKNIMWTEDEGTYVRLFKDVIRIHGIEEDTHSDFKLKDVETASVSPGTSPKLAAFVMDKTKSTAHKIYTYDINSMDSGPLTKASIQVADSVTFLWSSCGYNLITLIMTDMDHTGRSYYGDTNIHLTCIEDKVSKRVSLDKPGSVHSAVWNPKKDEFAVVYGKMPAISSIYNTKGDLVLNLGRFRYNYASYNRQGTHLLLGGFGNLVGDIGIWDLEKNSRVASMTAPFTSECTWSYDGRYIMTSTLYKRLKVDNGLWIWHLTGVPVKKFSFSKLHQTSWKPEIIDPESTVRDQSPPPIPIDGYVHPESHEGEIYRPSNSSHALSISSGQSTSPQTNSYYKYKKKDGKNGDESSKKYSGHGRGLNPEAPVFTTLAGKDPAEIQKRIKLINKKLKQIGIIKEKVSAGKTVELNQLESIEREEALRKEIELLEGKLKPA